MSEWRTLLAIDFDKHAAATYAANFPGVEVRCASVADEIANLPGADVLTGGFPCQPHSLAGKRLASQDERDGGHDFVAAIEKVKPRMFLGENVAGLMTSEDGRYAQRLLAKMESAGYVVEWRVLDAVDFGVPQFRSRVWFWGIRCDLHDAGVRHAWPTPTHVWPWPDGDALFADNDLIPAVTVGQALGIGQGGIRRARGASVDRRDHGIDEPCPAIVDGSGGSGGVLRIIGGGYNPPAGQPERRTERDITDEPSTSRSTCSGNALPEVQEYRWSPAMLEKHPPASPASPAPTVQAKWHKGGAEGLVRIEGATGYSGQRILDKGQPSPAISACNNPEFVRDPKHPTHSADRPGVTLRGGGDGHGPPNHTIQLTVDTKQHRTERAIDESSTTVAHDDRRELKAGGIHVRRLTPLECLRLMSGPDDFRWPPGITKTAIYRIVGNGWASRMGHVFAQAFRKADPASRTVIDLYCGGGLGAVGWHGRYWSYDP